MLNFVRDDITLVLENKTLNSTLRWLLFKLHLSIESSYSPLNLVDRHSPTLQSPYSAISQSINLTANILSALQV